MAGQQALISDSSTDAYILEELSRFHKQITKHSRHGPILDKWRRRILDHKASLGALASAIKDVIEARKLAVSASQWDEVYQLTEGLSKKKPSPPRRQFQCLSAVLALWGPEIVEYYGLRDQPVRQLELLRACAKIDPHFEVFPHLANTVMLRRHEDSFFENKVRKITIGSTSRFPLVLEDLNVVRKFMNGKSQSCTSHGRLLTSTSATNQEEVQRVKEWATCRDGSVLVRGRSLLDLRPAHYEQYLLHKDTYGLFSPLPKPSPSKKRTSGQASNRLGRPDHKRHKSNQKKSTPATDESKEAHTTSSGSMSSQRISDKASSPARTLADSSHRSPSRKAQSSRHDPSSVQLSAHQAQNAASVDEDNSAPPNQKDQSQGKSSLPDPGVSSVAPPLHGEMPYINVLARDSRSTSELQALDAQALETVPPSERVGSSNGQAPDAVAFSTVPEEVLSAALVSAVLAPDGAASSQALGDGRLEEKELAEVNMSDRPALDNAALPTPKVVIDAQAADVHQSAQRNSSSPITQVLDAAQLPSKMPTRGTLPLEDAAPQLKTRPSELSSVVESASSANSSERRNQKPHPAVQRAHPDDANIWPFRHPQGLDEKTLTDLAGWDRLIHDTEKQAPHSVLKYWITPVHFASILDVSTIGDDISKVAETHDVIRLDWPIFKAIAEKGTIFSTPLIVKEAFSDADEHSTTAYANILQSAFPNGFINTRAHEESPKATPTSSVVDMIRSTPHKVDCTGTNLLDLENLTNAIKPGLARVPRFRLLEYINQGTKVQYTGKVGKQANLTPWDIGACQSFEIFGFRGAFSGAHVDSVGGTWLRNLFGVKLWMIVPESLMTETDWADFGRDGPSWNPRDKARAVILRPGDVFFMPPGLKVVHAVQTLETCLMSGGMVWDELTLLPTLRTLLWICRNQHATNEAIPYQLKAVLENLEWRIAKSEISSTLPCVSQALEIQEVISELRGLGCQCCSATRKKKARRGCGVGGHCPCHEGTRRCTPLCNNHSLAKKMACMDDPLGGDSNESTDGDEGVVSGGG